MPKVVNNMGSSFGIVNNSQHKAFKHNGYYYIFWIQLAGVGNTPLYYKYATSITGLLAAPTQTLHANTRQNAFGYCFDVYYDSANSMMGITYAYTSSGGWGYLYFQYGTFNIDGSISFGSAHDCLKVTITTSPSYIHLNKTIGGKWVVSCTRVSGITPWYRLAMSTTSTPTASANWSTAFGDFIAPDSTDNNCVCSVGTSGDKWLLMYRDGTSKLAWELFDGTVLTNSGTTVVLITSLGTYSRFSSSQRNASGNVHLVVDDDTDEGLKELIFDATAETWSTTTIVAAPGTNAAQPTFIINSSGRYAFIIETNVVHQGKVYFYKNQTGSWQDATIELPAEIAGDGIGTLYPCPGSIFVIWASGSDIYANNEFQFPEARRAKIISVF